MMEFTIDASLIIKLAVAFTVFVLTVAGLLIFVGKLLMTRVYAAIKTLFDWKENVERDYRKHDERITRTEKAIIRIDPTQDV